LSFIFRPRRFSKKADIKYTTLMKVGRIIKIIL